MVYHPSNDRQKRLSSLFGDLSRWDFSVVACHWQRPKTQAEFDRICEAQGLDPNRQSFVHEIPPTSEFDKFFNPAVIIKAGDMRQASIKTTQTLYTHIGCVPYDKATDEGIQEQLGQKAKDIVGSYRRGIESLQEKLHFTDDMHAMGEHSELAFKFLVHRFDPLVCHHSNNTVLRPLTLLSDSPVKPAKSTYRFII